MSSKFGNAFDGAASPETVRKAEARLQERVDEQRLDVVSVLWLCVHFSVLPVALICIIWYWGWCSLIPQPLSMCIDDDTPLWKLWMAVKMDEFQRYCTHVLPMVLYLWWIWWRDLALGIVVPIWFWWIGHVHTASILSVPVTLFYGTVAVAIVVMALYSLLLVCVLGVAPLVDRVRRNHAAKEDVSRSAEKEEAK